MALFTPAVKEQLKARVAIDGPTGSGKTWTALQWARILAGADGAVGVIDTENRSAAYYAAPPTGGKQRARWFDPPYTFGHLPVSAPYDPRQLAQLIDQAGAELGDDGVLVIDSLTHYWSGEGGTRDIVDAAAERARGNSFAGWKEGTPAQRYMLDKIIHAPCHIVVTMRSKMEYILEEVTRNGRTIQQPRKVGMAPEQRSGVEYEFTLVLDMDHEHRLVVSKSRCDEIADVVAPAGRSHEPAEVFAAWLGSGVAKAGAAEVQAIRDAFDDVTDVERRKALQAHFVEQFGKPADLNADQVAAAAAWIDTNVIDAATGEITEG